MAEKKIFKSGSGGHNTKKFTKLQILESIAENIKTLRDSDLTSVDEAITLDKDLDDITNMIAEIKAKKSDEGIQDD